MGIEITPRAKYLRTLLSEYSRLCDHITCIAASLMELGAMTPFLYLVMIRDYMYEHIAALTGARVTYTYGRIGGASMMRRTSFRPSTMTRLSFSVAR